MCNTTPSGFRSRLWGKFSRELSQPCNSLAQSKGGGSGHEIYLVERPGKTGKARKLYAVFV